MTTKNPAAAAAAPVVPAAPAAAAAPASGAAPAPWYANETLALDQETKDYLDGKNFGGIGDAIKSMRDFETLARDRNAIAAPEAGKEKDWAGWEKLGWVPDAAKYTVEPPKLPAGVEWDGKVHDVLVKTMHENKVPLPAASALIAALGQMTAEGTQAMVAEDARIMAEQQAKLKAEWGTDYDAKLDLAKRVVRVAGIPAETLDQMADIAGFHIITKAFAGLGEKLSEDVLVTGQGGGASSHPATARAERLRLESDAAFTASLRDARHPQHQANTARRNQLLAQEAGPGR